MNNRFNLQKGFTLLEMLVVLGIIVVIVAVGSVSFSTSQKKARDAKRKGDIKVMQNAMEQYYSICGYNYPTPAAGAFSSIYCPSPTTGVMSTVPTDPRTTTPYPCTGCTGSAYTLCATLESESGTFCVNNQQ